MKIFYANLKKYIPIALLFSLFLPIGHLIAEPAQSAISTQAQNNSLDQNNAQADAKSVETEVKAFNDKVLRFNLLYASTVANTLSIYADSNEASKLLEQVNSVKSQSDVKLQSEALKILVLDFSKQIQKLTSDPEFSNRTQQLNVDGAKKLRAATPSFLILMLQSRGILESGKKLVNSDEFKNQNAVLILSVNDSLPTLMTSVASLSTSLPKISNALKQLANSPETKSVSN